MSNLLRSSLLSVLLLSSGAAFANGGSVGYSGLNGVTCNACHAGGGAALSLGGSTNAVGGTKGTYSVNGPGNSVDIAIDNAKLVKLTPTGGGLITSINPGEVASRSGGPWTFTLDLPHTGGTVKVYASAVAGTALASPTSNLVATINFSTQPGPPLVAEPAKPAMASTTGKTIALSVLGADDSPESTLTYTWSATGPGSATFTPNGTNAAKATSGTFTMPGTYKVTATLTDPTNLTSTSVTEVNIGTVLSAIVITPDEVGVPPGTTQQFTAQGKDQFGGLIAELAGVTWSVTPGGGVINATTGFYRAPSTVGTTVTVSAQSGQMRNVATVFIANGTPPRITTPASSTVTGLTAALTVGVGADDGSLKYTWSSIGGAGAVTFSKNGDNAAKNTTATFAKEGIHKIQVQVKSSVGLTASNIIEVNAGTNSTSAGEGIAGTADGGTGGTSKGGGGGCTATGQLALWTVLALLPLVAARRRFTR
ncbi:MAG: PKD domain-containing protein [Myxococcaceae bacterium]